MYKEPDASLIKEVAPLATSFALLWYIQDDMYQDKLSFNHILFVILTIGGSRAEGSSLFKAYLDILHGMMRQRPYEAVVGMKNSIIYLCLLLMCKQLNR